MSELSILSQDVTKGNADRSLYNQEFQTLAAYITNSSSKDFNGVSLFSATALSVTTDGDGGLFSMGRSTSVWPRTPPPPGPQWTPSPMRSRR